MAFALASSLSAADNYGDVLWMSVKTGKVGTFSQNDAPLKGKQYSLGSEKIVFSRYDAASGTLLMRTRNGLMDYSFSQDSILWSYDVKKGDPVHFFGDKIITFGSDIVCLDRWKGNLLWSRPLRDGVRFSEYFMEGNASLLAVTTTLRHIDLSDGQGWEYEVDKKQRIKNASKQNTVVTGMESVFGAASNLMASFIKGQGEDGSDYMSQYVAEGDFIYYAAANFVYKIEKPTGKLVWKSQLSTNTNGDALLFAHDDTTLFYMNKGVHSSWGTVEPYFVVVDKEDGHIVHNGEARGMDFIATLEQGDRVYALTKDRFARIYKDSCWVEQDIIVKPAGGGKLNLSVFLDASSLYEGEFGAYKPIVDTACIYVLRDDELFAVNKNTFSTVNRYDMNNIWAKVFATEQFSIYTKKGSSVFVSNQTGDLIAETKNITEATLRGGNLCALIDGAYTEIKLSDIVKSTGKGKSKKKK
jgi:outer membrane protein assembly factor BamB